MNDTFNIPQIHPDESAKKDLPVYMQVPAQPVAPVAPKPIAVSTPPVKPVIKLKKTHKKLKIIFGFALAFTLLLFFLFYSVYNQSQKLMASARILKDSVATKNLDEVGKKLVLFEKDYQSFSRSYSRIKWLKIVPYFGSFVGDGGKFVAAGQESLYLAKKGIEVVKPFADLIGFSNGGEAKQETAEDRINFVINSTEKLTPELDTLETHIKKINQNLSGINTAKYPEKLGKYRVRSLLESGLANLTLGTEIFSKAKPLVGDISNLMGVETPKTYLIIFQNDKELRPTGGFITAYSLLQVDKGKLNPVSSNDIYNLDSKYKPSIPAPDPIIKYLKGPYVISKYLRLRDMNWNPDFSESMKTFVAEIDKVGIRGVDGVISVDTQVLVNLLEVIGEIQVPGFGAFSNKIIAECNCSQVIYELESFADVEGPIVWDPAGTGKIIYAPANYENRKKIIGPLMNAVIANAMAQPKEKMPKLLEAGYKSITGKNIMFFLFDEKTQANMATFGATGSIGQHTGDFLHINDANLGGRKSNLYATQEVLQTITFDKNGNAQKTLEITYKNPEKYDGWLNSVLPNFVRIYVPRGSKLTSFEGAEETFETYEDLGYTVFSGFFQLRPQGVVKLRLTYTLPIKKTKKYELFIQKQPGTVAFPYTLTLGKNTQEFLLNSDKNLSL
jgi:hypothetical protein